MLNRYFSAELGLKGHIFLRHKHKISSILGILVKFVPASILYLISY